MWTCKTITKISERRILEYFLDEDFTQQQFDMEFGGDASYPQIQIDAKHVGTLKDTLHYLQECGKI